MPGIVMDGTLPVFFKIPVTKALVTHIGQGTYPPEESRVTFCYPPIPHSPDQCVGAMKPLGNRYEILRCFEAFKAIAGI